MTCHLSSPSLSPVFLVPPTRMQVIPPPFPALRASPRLQHSSRSDAVLGDRHREGQTRHQSRAERRSADTLSSMRNIVGDRRSPEDASRLPDRLIGPPARAGFLIVSSAGNYGLPFITSGPEMWYRE